MASVLESLAMGLRDAGSILDPGVYSGRLKEEDMVRQTLERRRDISAQQLIRGAEMGAIPAEAAKEGLKKLGYGDIPVSVGPEALARQEAMARRKAITEAVNALPPEERTNPAKLASVFLEKGEFEKGAQYINAAETRNAQIQARKDALDARMAQIQAQAEQKNLDREGRERYQEMMIELRRQGMILQGEIARGNQALRAAQIQASANKDGGGVSGEAAGKVAMADQAIMDLNAARKIIFDKDGKLNKGIVAGINLPMSGGMPFNTDAKNAYSALYNAMESKLRIETGAAATEREITSILNRFLPRITDTDESAKQKLDRLDSFFNTTIDQTKGVRKELLRSRVAPSVQVPSGNNVLRFDAQGNQIP